MTLTTLCTILAFNALFCIFVISQPPTFTPYQFEIDGLQISRGYFQSLNSKQQCENINYENCIYSNFINTPNILFLPSSTSSTTFTSSFKLAQNEAIVIGGFAPPLSKYFTITPYASFVNGIQSFSSISNNSLSLNSTFFLAVISGDLYTFDIIREWFRTANTSLTTAIYNNQYLYQIPIVQVNDELNIDENTEYSVIIRHETITSLQDDLYYVFSQSPSLMAWKVSVIDYDATNSEIITNLNQLRQQGNDEWLLSLKDITINKDSKTKTVRIDQSEFNVINYNSSQCLRQETECNFDQPESVIFASTEFNIKKRRDNSKTKIIISGINHVSTGNAIYSTVNIVDVIDQSLITQITLNEIITDDADSYIVVFAANCESVNEYCQEIQNIDLLCGNTVQIVEIISNEIGIDYTYLQPPNVVIQTITNSKTKQNRKHTKDNSNNKKDRDYEYNKQNDKSPNILMIFMDDLGWKDVGYNGAEFNTPNMDNLAESGIILNQYYVHPVCSPTRTAFYTGRYAFRYNLTIPLDIGQRRFLPQQIDTLPEILSDNGYDTHLVGKWHIGNGAWNQFPFSRGFDTFYGFSGGFIDYYNHQQCWEAWDGTPYPSISGANNLRLLNSFFPEGICVYDFFDEKKLDINTEYFTKLFADRAIDIISEKNKDSNPFFMFFSMGTPHTPIVQPPENFTECDPSLELYGIDRYHYCNMILEGDYQIGRIVNALKQNNLWENTILIFSTDNGGIANAIPGNIIWGSFGNNLQLRGQKSSPFEGGNRGIAFLNGGYLDKYNLNGIVNNKLYHVADWYKTMIYGIAGINYIDNSSDIIDSFNIWNSIINQDIASPRDEWVWTVNFGGSPIAIRQDDFKLVMNPQPFLDGYWDVDEVIFAPGQNQSETVYLFNISNDEIEAINLKDVYPNIVNDLQQRIVQIQEDGFTSSNDLFELEGFVIAVLSGTSLPFLELTQEITIDLN